MRLMSVANIVAIGAGALALATTSLTSAASENGYAAPAAWGSPMEESLYGTFLFDRLEYAVTGEDEASQVWDFQGWYGGDVQRVYLKGEGENTLGDGEAAEFESLELLYSHLVAPFWELQGGLGYQGGIATDDHPERSYAVASLVGTTPYLVELTSSLRLSEDGDLAASLEAERDLRITQRTILQPRVELKLAADRAEAFGVGQGLNSTRFGLRLRYEVSREFAPYVGAYWEKQHGDTADMTRAEGGDVEETGIVAGVRMWF